MPVPQQRRGPLNHSWDNTNTLSQWLDNDKLPREEACSSDDEVGTLK